MIYQQLFDRVREPQVVRAALIGAGDFGTAIVTQSRFIPRLKFCVVADIDLKAAISVYQRMGYTESQIAVCRDKAGLLAAMKADTPAVVQDADLLMDLPLDVITTATRVPEAGARYAYGAITHGKHVILVDKETDSVVAPMLKRLADEAGVVFSTDDGDEPGLLMGLVGWCRSLGMEVLCGGNIDHCLYDPERHLVIKGSEGSGAVIPIAPEDRWALEPIPPGEVARYVEARKRIFASLMPIKETGDPVSHMSLPVNATGLMPDTHGVHRPVARFTELPLILCPVEDGGILDSRGCIEQPIILHEKDQPHGGGGIFVTVTHADEYSRHIMAYKGLHHNPAQTSMLIYRPYHLCGSETAMSILCAGLLKVPTGAQEILPRVDIVAETTRAFKAGEVFGGDKGTLAFGFSLDFKTTMAPAQPLGSDRPVPYFMLYGNKAAVDIPAGALVTGRMVTRPADSVLWRLRDQQDHVFLGKA